jgi:hypothetical protein
VLYATRDEESGNANRGEGCFCFCGLEQGREDSEDGGLHRFKVASDEKPMIIGISCVIPYDALFL